HVPEVAALQEIGADERATDAESHHAGPEVLRDLVEVDVARRNEREMHEGAPHVRDEIRSADRRHRKHLYEVGTEFGRLDHLGRSHRPGHAHGVTCPRGLDHLGHQDSAHQEACSCRERLLRLSAGEHRSRAHDRPVSSERLIERELLDDLERVRDRQRDLHKTEARFAHRASRLTRDLRAPGPDHGDEPVFPENPDQIATERQRSLGDRHLLDGTCYRVRPRALADATDTLSTRRGPPGLGRRPSARGPSAGSAPPGRRPFKNTVLGAPPRSRIFRGAQISSYVPGSTARRSSPSMMTTCAPSSVTWTGYPAFSGPCGSM